jgi:hypothetical protein
MGPGAVSSTDLLFGQKFDLLFAKVFVSKMQADAVSMRVYSALFSLHVCPPTPVFFAPHASAILLPLLSFRLHSWAPAGGGP